MTELERVASLDQFVKVVSASAQKWQQGTWDRRTESSWLPWFRGEENADWTTALRPKLYRTKHKLKEVLRQEQDLRLEFKRRGAQFVGEGKPSDHWERYRRPATLRPATRRGPRHPPSRSLHWSPA